MKMHQEWKKSIKEITFPSFIYLKNSIRHNRGYNKKRCTNCAVEENNIGSTPYHHLALNFYFLFTCSVQRETTNHN